LNRFGNLISDLVPIPVLKIKHHWRSVLTRYSELKLAVISSVGQFFEVLDSQCKIGKSCVLTSTYLSLMKVSQWGFLSWQFYHNLAMHRNLAKPRMCACVLLYQEIRAGDSVIGTKFI
jgi:hypothetical protein